LVDDNPTFGDVLRIGLKAVGGHTVDVVPTARDGLSAIRGGQYALALVEYSGGGREFLRGYRAIDPLLAVVVLTALPGLESAVEFLSGGSEAMAIHYIVKPEPNLLRILNELIDERFARVAHGDWAFDRKTGKGFYQGEELNLTPTETGFFGYFMLHPYEDVEHEALWLAARGERLERDEAVEAVRSHLSRLAAKLEEIAGRCVIQHRHKGPHRFMPTAPGRATEGDSLSFSVV
jgi:DNA-binding response OmpR family regulator